MFARRVDPVQVLALLRDAPGTATSVGRALSLTPVEANGALRWGQQSGLLVQVAPSPTDPDAAAYLATDRGRTFLDGRRRLEQGLTQHWPAEGRPSGEDLLEAYAEWAQGQGPVPVDRVRAVLATLRRTRHALAALAVLVLVGGLVVELVR